MKSKTLAAKKPFREATWQAGSIQTVAKSLAKFLKDETGVQFTFTGSEKLRKAKAGVLFVLAFNSSKVYLRFLFKTPTGEILEMVEVYGSNPLPVLTVKVGDLPEDQVFEHLKEICDYLKKGRSALKSVTPIKAQPDQPILTQAEKDAADLAKKLLIADSDLKANVRELAELTADVASGTADNRGLLVTGTPGVGKTYTTRDVIENQLGMSEGSDFVLKEGGSGDTIEIYEILHDNPDKTIIFDDYDTVWKSADRINMLKGALQTGPSGRVSMKKGEVDALNVKRKKENMPPIATSFDFTGNIIFISNLTGSQLSAAAPVLDRVFHVHFDISYNDLISYMEEMLEKIRPDVSLPQKMEAFKFFKTQAKNYKSFKFKKSISIRALVRTIGFYVSRPQDWERKAINFA